MDDTFESVDEMNVETACTDTSSSSSTWENVLNGVIVVDNIPLFVDDVPPIVTFMEPFKPNTSPVEEEEIIPLEYCSVGLPQIIDPSEIDQIKVCEIVPLSLVDPIFEFPVLVEDLIRDKEELMQEKLDIQCKLNQRDRQIEEYQVTNEELP